MTAWIRWQVDHFCSGSHSVRDEYVPTQVPQTVGDGAVVASQALGIGIETGWLIGNNSGDQVACVSQARQKGIHKYH